nr:MAG TPA: hypothetical protein [Caudoviricetes sp.]
MQKQRDQACRCAGHATAHWHALAGRRHKADISDALTRESVV